MGKFFKFLLLLVVVIIIGAVGYLAYLGFIPGLSDWIGANKPKDLGIRYTSADFDANVKKLSTEITYVPANSGGTLTFSGQKSVTQSFTSADTSARMNYSKWQYMPVANTQVRFNADGSVEFSGNLLASRLPGFISAIGGVSFTQDEINKGLSMVKTNPPVYIKVTPTSIQNDQVNLSFSSIQVGKLNVPIDSFDANSFFSNLTKQVMGKVSGFHAKSVTITDGQLNFSGTVPASMQVPQAP